MSTAPDSPSKMGRVKKRTVKEPATFKLGVRLLTAIDDRIRELTRRTGDFSKFVAEAIMTVDLDEVPLVLIRDPKVPLNTVRVEKKVYDRLNKAVRKRDTSMNVIINTAVAHWMETKKQKVRFQDWPAEGTESVH
jgi:hypothetical protein